MKRKTNGHYVPQHGRCGSAGWETERTATMAPDHPLAPLLRELCPKRYPVGWPKRQAVLALDPIEIYELACQLGARAVTVAAPPGSAPK